MAEIKKKKVKLADRDFSTGELPELPPGFSWVYNRLGKEWEHPFNGAPFVFKPYQVRFLETPLAKFMRKHSVLKEDPNRPKQTIRAIVMEDDVDEKGETLFRVPLPAGYDRGMERLDRSNTLGFDDRAIVQGTKVEFVKVD